MQLHNRRGNASLNQIIASDEASLQWKEKDENTPWKFKTHPSVGKAMASVFKDNEDILLVEYFLKIQNANQHIYFDTFIKLYQVVKAKHWGKRSKKIFIL